MEKINKQNEEIFHRACDSGITRNLGRLIASKKFDVNTLIRSRAGESMYPLTLAVKRQSYPVVKLLLDCGADITAGNFAAVIKAIDVDIQYETNLDDPPRVVLNPILSHAIREAEKPRATQSMKKLGKFARLCLAVIHRNEEQIAELLEAGDYTSYAGILKGELAREYRPSWIAFWIDDMVEPFILAGVDRKYIYIEAASLKYIDLVELCHLCGDFDPSFSDGGTALHWACEGQFSDVKRQWEVIELAESEGDIESRDPLGRTPIFEITNAELMERLFDLCPEVNVNLVDNEGDTLLMMNKHKCDIYRILLEHGTDPELKSTNSIRHVCDELDYCHVKRHLKKLYLLDEDYVEIILTKITSSCNVYDALLRDNPDEQEFKEEIVKMKGQQISASTSYSPGRNLFDFILLGPNEAARLARNTELLRIYEENDKDFRGFLPHYGFALNHQLRRCRTRKERFDKIQQLAVSILDEGVLDDFVELVFGNLSNNSLKLFNVGKEDD